MKSLLIVEESLRDLKAHWFEYIQTIIAAANKQNWSVDVACHQDAAPEIKTNFSTFPIFRYARYLDNTKKKLPAERYYSFILHSFRCLQVLWPLLAKQKRYEHIFVPTVLVHHLLAWWIIATFHPHKPHHLTLFFVTNPGIWNAKTQTSSFPKSVAIQKFLLKLFRQLIQKDKVTFAVETTGAQQEFKQLTNLPFVLFPHPVPEKNSSFDHEKNKALEFTTHEKNQSLCFACYGFARYEKGSDLLAIAIEELLKNEPNLNINFRIQWTDSFSLPDGRECQPSQFLLDHPQVKIIDQALLSEEYQTLLQTTDCMILPYRNSSYYARLSRIAIEASCFGIPMIYTGGGWLEEIVEKFGSGIKIRDENSDNLIQAIKEMILHYSDYHYKACRNQAKSQEYFSGDNFCRQLLH